MDDNIKSAFYELSDPQAQMISYIFDTLRGTLCSMTLDRTFEAKDEISERVKINLAAVFSNYGFEIYNALVTDISPNERVRHAMNEINSSLRFRDAAYQKAEGEKVLRVKRAEAEAESMHLQGVGIARSRHAIMDGLRDSIVEFSSEVSGANAKDVMDLLVLTQYFDTLQDIGKRAGCKVTFIPQDQNAMRAAILEANSVL